MTSHAWVLGVRPGYEDDYKRRHDELWPEMDAALRNAGIRNYHIFRHGLTLFGYFETDDLARTIAILRDDPVNRRWSEHMADIMVVDIDPRTGFPVPRRHHTASAGLRKTRTPADVLFGVAESPRCDDAHCTPPVRTGQAAGNKPAFL